MFHVKHFCFCVMNQPCKLTSKNGPLLLRFTESELQKNNFRHDLGTYLGVEQFEYASLGHH